MGLALSGRVDWGCCVSSSPTRPSLRSDSLMIREGRMSGTLKPPRNPRYASLDLWRGIACLMIVILHAAHHAGEAGQTAGTLARAILAVFSKLGSGVPMFFVISGYCIAATSDSSRRK